MTIIATDVRRQTVTVLFVESNVRIELVSTIAARPLTTP